MKTRCEGCGVKIQTEDPTKKGYIKSEVYLKNPDNFYCERCYNLIHYNRRIDVQYSEEDFLKNIKTISKSEALVVNIVDIFDLEGTYIEKLNEYFPKNKILLVANKFDLFLKSVKVEKVKSYLNSFLREKNIYVDQSLIISSFKDDDIIRLLKKIEKLQEGKDVYLFGMTNVGKSSIINGITKILGKNSKITVSNTIGTTLDFIKIALPNRTFLIDTPGILNTHQATYYLSKENSNLLTLKKYVKPKVFQLNPEQALFIGGFCVIKFTKGIRSSFIVNVSNALVIHRTKLENADNFFEEHKDDILQIPNFEERSKMGDLIKHKFTFSEEKKDITISGLGFITLVGEGEVEVECYQNIRVSERSAII